MSDTERADLRYSPAFECKFDDLGKEGTFSGLASPFGGQADAYGDIIEKGAFAKSLAAHSAAGTRPIMLRSHDPDSIIGTWTHLAETDAGLEVRGKLAMDIPAAKEVHTLWKAGAMNGLSIGFKPVEWRRMDGGRALTEVDLWEVSAVAFPAAKGARVTDVKSAITDIRSFETELRDVLGFSAREAKRLASGGWPAYSDRDGGDDGIEELVRATLARTDFLKSFH